MPAPANVAVRSTLVAAAFAAFAIVATGGVIAAEPEFTLVIKDHKFQPTEVKVPANQKIKLIVDNQDATAEEFESHSLKREKVIGPKSKATIMIGPLKPGRYPFVGEFHEATAKGVVIAE